MEPMKVKAARLRAYNVGFGDCLLLKLTYDDRAESTRCLLFDFGSTRKPDSAGPDHMEVIARDIAAESLGKLAMVVATHRHSDHISGFGDNTTGPIIAGLNPSLVVQPWTEDPDLPVDATGPVRGVRGQHAALTRSLTHMHAFAAGAAVEAGRLAALDGFPPSLAERLSFLGETNLKNTAAVKRLMTMGERRIYAKYGDRLPVVRLIPDVTIDVIGPPTLAQAPAIATMARTNANEFWQLAGRWGSAVAKGDPPPGAATLAPLFPRAALGRVPQAARWLVPQLTRAYADDMLSILRVMDDVLNNTSLILLVQIGGARGTLLLFPGDAQIENWSYALFDAPDHEKVRARLARTNVYKVGHHGSLNATPKTLWKGFRHRQDDMHATSRRLVSVMSTKSGKHGSRAAGTEVPRGPLVEALDNESTLVSTPRHTSKTKPWVDVRIPLH
jgi:hypothetical protein